jgi:TRAP-type C4-dicarboxylate transport system permease small subunit
MTASNDRLEAIEKALQEAGMTAEGAPENAILVSWVVATEWASVSADDIPTSWVEYSAPLGQGFATTVGLARILERLADE